MAKKTTKPERKCDLPPVAVGTRILLKRPHLWGGCIGIVESYDAGTTKHRCRIAGRNGATFQTDAYASEIGLMPDSSPEDLAKEILG